MLWRVREGVFSSTGFRIRAAQPAAATAEVARWVERAVASVFFTLFPADCRLCGSPLLRFSRLPVCENCLGSLRPMAGPRCRLCGEGLSSPLLEDRPDAVCGLCRRVHPPFERASAYGSYDGALRDLVHLLKFEQVRPAAAVLGRMLANAIAALEPSLPPGTIAVVPVPLHARKKSQRGFNQAELIVRAALKDLSRPERFRLCAGSLIRIRDTGSQIGLTRHQRRQNLRGAFVVKDPAAISGRNLLLVDDVYTTGSTASECARVLRRAGAARVWVATVARTLRVSESSVNRGDLLLEHSQEENLEEAQDRAVVAAHA